MNDLLQTWRLEFQTLQEALYDIGAQGDSLRYNLLSTEALRLSRCIIDLQDELMKPVPTINLKEVFKNG